MDVFILVDMEGISGICRRSQVINGEEHYQEGRQYMTWDVNACVKGCLEAGAGHIVVRDIHATTSNLIWHELIGGAEYIMGSSRMGRMPGIESFDAVILLGYHSMAGTPMGILEHTSSSTRWQNFWINGIKAGELAIDGARAGEQGVPVVMVSGDDKTCKEADALFPGAELVEVKKGLDIEGGFLLAKDEAHEVIREHSQKALKKYKQIKPYAPQRPVTLRLELVSRGALPCSEHVNIIDGRTYEVTADTVTDALKML